MTVIKLAKRCPAVIVISLPLLAVITSPIAFAQEGAGLPRITGTGLPGTNQALLDITIDGIPAQIIIQV